MATTRERSERIKALYAEAIYLESVLRAKEENLSSSIDRIKKASTSLKNKYIIMMTGLIDQSESDEKQKLIEKMSIIHSSFDDFMNSIRDNLFLALTAESEGQTVDVAFKNTANLQGCDAEGNIINLTEIIKTDVGAVYTLLINFKAGVKALQELDEVTKKREINKKEYNELISGTSE